MDHERSLESRALFAEEKPVSLSPEQEETKRAIYEKMNPRRRKFIDKIGYEVWNPFQEPKEPLDLRRDRTRRTITELISDFKRDAKAEAKSPEWLKGATECAVGIIKKDERFQGIFDFCLWYHAQLNKEEKNETKI